MNAYKKIYFIDLTKPIMVRFDDIYLYIILFFKIFSLIMLFSQLFYIFKKGKMTIGNSEELFLFFVFLF